MDGFRHRSEEYILPEFRDAGSGIGPKHCDYLFGSTPAHAEEYGFRHQSARRGDAELLQGLHL